ncbi:MAG: hypothetical protein JO122_07440, partial [Acetobacteraceae bacterium]|nr:hypothetical protein [Acetobacteraceae bacterium]
YRRFPACRAGANDHAYCAGFYIAKERDIVSPATGSTILEGPVKSDEYEVLYKCNCPGHLSGTCGSARTDLFHPNRDGAPVPSIPRQGKLF